MFAGDDVRQAVVEAMSGPPDEGEAAGSGAEGGAAGAAGGGGWGSCASEGGAVLSGLAAEVERLLAVAAAPGSAAEA
jgi:hypothetical protein